MNAQSPTILTRFPFTSFKEALRLHHCACAHGLPAAYMPSGGDRNSQVSIPILHVIYILATQEQLKELQSWSMDNA